MHLDQRLLKNFSPSEKVIKIDTYLNCIKSTQWTPIELSIAKLLIYSFCNQQYTYNAILKNSMVDLDAMYLMDGKLLTSSELRRFLHNKTEDLKAIWFDLSSIVKQPMHPLAFNEHLFELNKSLPKLFNNRQAIIQQQQ